MKHAYLDLPKPGSAAASSSISIAGWIYGGADAPGDMRIQAWLEGELIGETRMLFLREDVCAALRLRPEVATGFRILGSASHHAGPQREVELIVLATWPDGEQFEIGRCPVRLQPARFEQWPYGEVVYPTREDVLHREDIYGSGPPIEEPNDDVLRLIKQHLSAGASVLDVGCGAGAYGPSLRAAGHDWLGLEVSPFCCELLAKRHLPFREVTSATLPASDGEFDHAICVEVLEHIEDPDIFLGEMARCIRGRALFSVPNIEIIPYLSGWQVVPWHLLEAEHKNFFTRAGLRILLQKHFARAEVFSYAEVPLRTPDGVPVHAHLFAVAETPSD